MHTSTCITLGRRGTFLDLYTYDVNQANILPELGAYYCLMSYLVLPNIHLWYEHEWSIGERNTWTKPTEHTQKKERSHSDAMKSLKC